MSFRRVLIANRGEIAVRVARTLREMGITPIAVFSDADRTAPHVRACDKACRVGPGPATASYLRQDALLAAAKETGAEAIHPGYGFLSENAAFADAVRRAGLTFIGPSAEAMRLMGSKVEARRAMEAANVPCVPGTPPLASLQEAERAAQEIGYPILLKASAGGGGKGMRLVTGPDGIAGAFRGARSEAGSAFGDDTIYIEKAIVRPRHIEIQIVGGPDGKSVWLGERECSMQRRHQKVIEETPAFGVADDLRRKMGDTACRAADAVGYVGAGTVEFLLDPSGVFYFLEMNTRLQVEHPVTELCCGIDLVEAQVRVALGEPLPWTQADIATSGHAIEARIYAEDPAKNFLPCPGYIDELVLPHGPGVRVDAGVASGFAVPSYYDPMLAKVIVWAENRERARNKMARALRETAVKGLTTNTAFLRRLIELPAFVKGNYHTGTVEALLAEEAPALSTELETMAVASMAIRTFQRDIQAARKAAVRDGGWSSAWRGTPWRRGVL